MIYIFKKSSDLKLIAGNKSVMGKCVEKIAENGIGKSVLGIEKR